MNTLLRQDAADQDTYYIDTGRIKSSMRRVRAANMAKYKKQLKETVKSLIRACETKRKLGKI